MSAGDLARFLDLNHRTVNVLAERGVLGRLASGKFDTADSVRRYVTFSRKGGDSALAAAKLRKTKAAADKAELANQKDRRELLEAADDEREWADRKNVEESTGVSERVESEGSLTKKKK